MYFPRTDLAIELQEFQTRQAAATEGVETWTEKSGDICISHVRIDTQSAAERIGKPKGNYITLEMKDLNFQDSTQYAQCCHALRDMLLRLHTYDSTRPVLVVGLGNRFITADALGPKAVDKIFVTRHMHAQLGEIFGGEVASVCAIAPGVLGITGVETAEIVQGVCDRVKPGVILVVDALAARSIERLNTTVQLCDTGIAPGSGVGNARAAFNQERFGVPVLAIGVPTVIDATTMAFDAACALLDSAKTENSDMLSCVKNLSESDLYHMVASLMQPPVHTLTVTPKDVDLAMERISKVIAGGINLYLHKDMTLEEVDALTM